MTVTLFLSPPKLPFHSTPFILKNPKPPISLPCNPSSHYLQNTSNSSHNTSINVTNNNIDDRNGKNNDFDDNIETIPQDQCKVKAPTAPWMKGQLLVDSIEVIDLSKPRLKKKASNFDTHKAERSLTEKVSGGMGKKAVKKIAQSVEKLQVGKIFVDAQKNWDDTHKNWGDFGGGFLTGKVEDKTFKRKMPWERSDSMVIGRVKKEKVVTAAELCLDKGLLERLRDEGSKMRKWVKVKKAGVTQTVVDEVHSIWANNELVMFKFDLPLCRNMDRAREIVEIKTGGLVVWIKKDSLVAYRGCDYHLRRRSRRIYVRSSREGQNSDGMDINLGIKPTDRSLYEREGDRLLDGLGPRFIDWWYPKPLPVDGDLLPELVPGFKPPFRLCPPNVRPQLTDVELTYLRKLARSLPVHFVLGRNSRLQGLAVAILKLWQKSVVAKIAVKWGVPNTNNELMATELKHLTGGVIILRNKFLIILYRGKDFLPGNVVNMVVERDLELQQWHLHEENARLEASEALGLNEVISTHTSMIGTFSEFQHIQTMCQSSYSEAEVKMEAEKENLKKELKRQEYKLAMLMTKIEKAERELLKLNSAWMPSKEEPDQELITEEERECFRKMGLKMDGVLVLGRRGVFDGVIEGMHQHWKHRELVKVITMQGRSLQIVYTARFLERESGGVLVSIDKLKKGHAIIIYRGKNYKRPIDFGDNLLDKKKALKNSIGKQRLGSLKFFAYQRGKDIADLRLKLENLEKSRNTSS